MSDFGNPRDRRKQEGKLSRGDECRSGSGFDLLKTPSHGGGELPRSEAREERHERVHTAGDDERLAGFHTVVTDSGNSCRIHHAPARKEPGFIRAGALLKFLFGRSRTKASYSNAVRARF